MTVGDTPARSDFAVLGVVQRMGQGHAAGLAGLGWLLGLAYSAGVLYWMTDRLNRGATPTGRSAVTLPVPVMWAGLAIVAVLLVVLVAAVRAGLTVGYDGLHLTA